ncbi:MAG: hypothetical protein AAFX03_10395 [Pseudomonadota bacterium]
MAASKKLPKLIVAASAGLVLAACATQPTPYQPAQKVNGEGYSSVKLEEGKHRIAFRGNTSTDLATVENYILLRAAELTVADGLGHFVILDMNDTSNSTFRSTGTTFGAGGFGRRTFFGGGIGTTSATTRQRRAFAVDVIVQAYPGDKPDDQPEAFNAAEVIENLSPIAVRTIS